MAETLLDIPASARRGEVIRLKMLIGHPMETGYRRQISGAVIPRDIITDFSCRYLGETVFAARLFPAIAANPYFDFPLLARESGPIELVWRGDHGFFHQESLMLRVSG